MTLSDLQSFGACHGSLAETKIYIFLLSFILYLRAISKFKAPPGGGGGLVFGGAILQRTIFSVTNMVYLEGLIFGILRYFPENFRCKLTYYESENFSGSSLHHIILGFLFGKKDKPNL